MCATVLHVFTARVYVCVCVCKDMCARISACQDPKFSAFRRNWYGPLQVRDGGDVCSCDACRSTACVYIYYV